MSSKVKRESIAVADVEEVLAKGRRMVATFEKGARQAEEGSMAFVASATTYLYLEVLADEIEKLLYEEEEETDGLEV